MYTETDLEALEKRVGLGVKKRFVDWLNQKGYRNSWGNPFSYPNLTPFWKGKKEDLTIEGYLLDFEEDYYDQKKKLEARKKALKSAAA